MVACGIIHDYNFKFHLTNFYKKKSWTLRLASLLLKRKVKVIKMKSDVIGYITFTFFTLLITFF